MYNNLFYSDVVGVVTMGNITSKILKGAVKATDKVSDVLYKQFEMVSSKIICHKRDTLQQISFIKHLSSIT